MGPADISQVLGVPGQFEHPRCLETIENIAKRLRRRGQTVGNRPSRAESMPSGCAAGAAAMFVLGFDIHAFHAGIRAAKERYALFVSTLDCARPESKGRESMTSTPPSLALNVFGSIQFSSVRFGSTRETQRSRFDISRLRFCSIAARIPNLSLR